MNRQELNACTCRFETHFVFQSLAEIDANREAFICAYDPCNLWFSLCVVHYLRRLPVISRLYLYTCQSAPYFTLFFAIHWHRNRCGVFTRGRFFLFSKNKNAIYFDAYHSRLYDIFSDVCASASWLPIYCPRNAIISNNSDTCALPFFFCFVFNT